MKLEENEIKNFEIMNLELKDFEIEELKDFEIEELKDFEIEKLDAPPTVDLIEENNKIATRFNKSALRLKEALKTSSNSKIDDTISELANFIITENCPEKIQGYQTEFNSLLASLSEMSSKDPIEQMLVKQLLCMNKLVMKSFRIANRGSSKEMKEAARLSTSFTSLVKALNNYRNQGQQKVKVEHVHVSDGGQAIIGDVVTGGGKKK